jgi:hypothetical protein
VNETPLNPYESPIIPEETPEKKSLPVGVVANFVMDEAGLRASAQAAFSPIPVWVHWASPVLVIAFGLLAMLAGNVAGAIGVFIILFGTFGTLVFIQVLRNRRVARAALARLQSHRVLGAIGPWKLTVDRQQIVVETPGGKQAFTRGETRVQAFETMDLVMWFTGELPIVIPEREPYRRMCQKLRLWFVQTAT